MTHIKHLGLLIVLIISNTSCIQGNTADTKNKNSAEKKGEIMTIEQDMVSYIKKGNLEKVQQYIEKTSAHINARGNNTDRDDWTSLIWATYYEQFEIVKYLVEKGADVNIRDEDTYTALMWASRQGYVEMKISYR